jgi:hypothetical protein
MHLPIFPNAFNLALPAYTFAAAIGSEKNIVSEQYGQ